MKATRKSHDVKMMLKQLVRKNSTIKIFSKVWKNKNHVCLCLIYSMYDARQTCLGKGFRKSGATMEKGTSLVTNMLAKFLTLCGGNEMLPGPKVELCCVGHIWCTSEFHLVVSRAYHPIALHICSSPGPVRRYSMRSCLPRNPGTKPAGAVGYRCNCTL